MTQPRKGARSRAEVTRKLLAALNAGTLETASLPEMLVLDFAALIRASVPDMPKAEVAKLRAAKTVGIVQRMALAGEIVFRHLGLDGLPQLRGHASDTVRGWAAYAVGHAPGLSLAERLRLIRPLADDAHFGVREWAWMPMRPHIAAEVETAVKLLQPWSGEASANLRRFAAESTRPRGVWTAHIDRLKREPALGLPLLDALRTDPSLYVQNSVANWLNDASKTQPEWVREVCREWLAGGENPITARICKRALRSLN